MTRASWEKTLLGGVILWTLLVFGHYFSPGKALDLSFISTIWNTPGRIDPHKLLVNGAGSLKIFLCCVLVGFTLWRWGRKLQHWLGLKVENLFLRFSLEMVFGILLFNGLWLGLGFNLLWFEPLLLPLLLLLFAAALWDLHRDFLRFQKFPSFAWPTRPQTALGLLGFLSLLLSLGQGSVPETYFDALVYHLSTLDLWSRSHGITEISNNLYSYYPFGGELYFFSGFLLQGSEAAKTLNAFAALLCALAAAGWAATEAGAAKGWLLWTLVLTFPLVSATVWTTQVDVVLALFLLLFFFTFSRWAWEGEGLRWVVAAGLLGGAALTVKYTAGLGIAASFLALGSTRREAFAPRKWKGWAVLLSLLALSVLPWLVKNGCATGNPFYPYLSWLMGGKALASERMAALMADHQSVLSGNFSPGDWFIRVFDRELDKTTAPLLYAFLPFLFLPGRWRPFTKFMLILSGSYLIGSFLLSYQPRLAIPALLSCMTAFAFVLGELKDPPWTRLWTWVLLVFSLLSFLSLCRLSVNYYQPFKVWGGLQTRQEYLSERPQTASYIGLTAAAKGKLIHSDRLLVAGDARGLYYPNAATTNSVFDEQVLETLARSENDGEGIRKALRKMGVDALAISGQEGMRVARAYGHYRLAPAEWAKLENFIQGWTDLVYLEGVNGIYRLRSQPVERKQRIPNLLSLFRHDP